MKKALVIGSVCADVTMHVNHLPVHEEDVNISSMCLHMGGCAYNVSDILRRNHIPYDLVSHTGSGIYGRYVKEQLKQKGIDPWYESEEENGVCFCLIEPNGDRTFMAVHGAEYHFLPEMFAKADPNDYACAYVCGIDLEDDHGGILLEEAERLSSAGVTIFYSPGPRLQNLDRNVQKTMIDLHPIIHLNRREASVLLKQMKQENNGKLSVSLHDLTGNAVIITDGANPVEWCDENGSVHETLPEKAEQKDGTGAGDGHIGMIIAARMQKKSWDEAVKLANHVSAEIIQTEGAQLEEPA